MATSCMHASPHCDNACSQIIIQSMAQKSLRTYDDDDEGCQKRIIKTWSSKDELKGSRVLMTVPVMFEHLHHNIIILMFIGAQIFLILF